jgi:hypothetical protein
MSNSRYNHSLADLNLEEKRFTEKSSVKTWLLAELINRKGIRIAIERSDDNKIIFKCKHRANGPPCSFRIRANYLIKLNSWSLVVINDTHNHDLNDFPSKPQKRAQSKSKIIGSVTKQIEQIIDRKVMKNDTLSEEDKVNIMESLTMKYITTNAKYLSDSFIQQLSNKSDKVINWSSIPLSPLLNDDTGNDSSSNSIEHLIHLPGLNLGQNIMLQNNTNQGNFNQNLVNGYSTPSNPIQNQNNQLPSFNSIQNKLPLSPTNLPALNNPTTTLNPSHLLKSTKPYGSSLYLSDFKNTYNYPLNNLKLGNIKDISKNSNIDNSW